MIDPEIVDSRTVRFPDGSVYDVFEAAAALEWVEQTCPQMRHEYVHQRKADPTYYAVVARMLKASNPETYRAYFRGYPTPTRYWEAPDGRRYWLTKFMINRCWPDTVEAPRRVAQGGKPIPGWDGPPWVPSGLGLYERGKGKTWWPTAEAVAEGYQRCKSCSRNHMPPDPT